SLPVERFEPPGHLVVYLPGFTVSENSLLSPGTTFSASPMIRSPERISNSLTSPEPELVTLNLVGPALIESLAGQPSSLMSTLTVAVLAPAGKLSPTVRTAPPSSSAAAARPGVCNMLRNPPRFDGQVVSTV